jgi:hypothetical protein
VVRHLRRLDEYFTAAAVVVDVVGHENAFETVLGATLEQEYVSAFEDDFGVDTAEARCANGDGSVVKEVVAGFCHIFLDAIASLSSEDGGNDQP